MERESFKEGDYVDPEKVPEKATDMELTFFLINHIDNPCEAEVAPGVKENIRGFYIARAKEIVSKMTNEHAKTLLESKIKEYQ